MRVLGRFSCAIFVLIVASLLTVKAGSTGNVPTVNFTAATNFTAGSLPFWAVTGDFNNDGILDIAITNWNSNNVSIFLGNGDGTFKPAQDFPTGTQPQGLAVKDLNGDGFLDLAVADLLGRQISILLGNGDGTFKPPVNYPVDRSPRMVAVADFNGDHIWDLAVANVNSNDVSILLGKGDGTFKPAVNYATDVHPKSVVVADFNGDGAQDLAIPNHDGNDVSVLLGNGDGTFKPAVNYPVGLNPRDIKVADFRGNGLLDLATANGGATTVSILLGNGDGTFQPAVNYQAGASPRFLAVADFNGDSLLDIVTSNYNGANVGVLLGKGDGSFAAPVYIPVGANPTGVVAADFNGDNRPDLAVGIGGPDTAPNTIVSVMLNDPLLWSPNSLTYPLQTLGVTSTAQTVTLTNVAVPPLAVAIGLTGPDSSDFSQTNTCGTSIPGNSSCTVSVTFTPKAPFQRSATLSIADNVPGNPQLASLTGTGTVVSFSPTSLNFGSQAVGTTSAPLPVILQNLNTKSALSITKIAISGANAADFGQTSNCGSSVPAGGKCTINVTFTPSATGSRSAALQVKDNGGGGTQSVPLSGSGT